MQLVHEKFPGVTHEVMRILMSGPLTASTRIFTPWAGSFTPWLGRLANQ